MLEPGWPLLLAVSSLFGLVLELLLLWLRWPPYLRMTFPLFPDLVPIPAPPEDDGTTASVHWAVVDEGAEVHWWANTSGDGLTGLHGVVYLTRVRGGVGLQMRWSPPWSPLLAAAALVIFGGLRGVPWMTLPIAAVMVIGLVLVYHQGAMRAATELRWAFVRGAEADQEAP